jgi:hypothetical protein
VKPPHKPVGPTRCGWRFRTTAAAEKGTNMTEKQMSMEIDRLLEECARRMRRLRLVKEGKLIVDKVWRKPHKVKAYKVDGHFVTVIRKAA